MFGETMGLELHGSLLVHRPHYVHESVLELQVFKLLPFGDLGWRV